MTSFYSVDFIKVTELLDERWAQHIRKLSLKELKSEVLASLDCIDVNGLTEFKFLRLQCQSEWLIKRAEEQATLEGNRVNSFVNNVYRPLRLAYSDLYASHCISMALNVVALIVWVW